MIASAGVIASTINSVEVLQLSDGNNTVDLSGTASIQTLIGGNDEDSLNAGSTDVTLQGWTGTAASNTASDTLTAGSGSDLFVIGDSTGNAYGNGGASVATILNFDTSKDVLQLHDFGGSTAGASGYQTLPGANPGQIDIFTYQGTGSGDQVASVTVTNGNFDWSKDVRLV